MRDAIKSGFNRRDFLKLTGATVGGATLMGMDSLRNMVYAGTADNLEKVKLTLGIIPLTDCAPLVIAKEKGYFKKYGLDVEISKEASWANIRDKVSIGALDGAHMLAGMPIAATLGIGALPKPTITAYSMDLNGNAITVSNELYERMVQADPEAMKASPTTAQALKKVIDADKAAGKEPLTFAMVFPVSTHNYQLRYWMASSGINPDKDVRLIVIPPPQMVANLKAGNIVGYCVGEPWNERAVTMDIGRTIITSYEIWQNNPEKVFGVNLAWADKNPNTHKALIMSLLEAAQWMDKPENRLEVVKIISDKSYVNAPEDVVKMSMTGTFKYSQKEDPRPLPDFNVFYRYAATFPWQSHAEWFISQMIRWGQIDKPLNIKKTATEIYRPDIYREAAKALNLPAPTIDYKTEGANTNGWELKEATNPIAMGADRFFDGKIFDPAKIVEYISSFEVHSLAMQLADLEKANV
ncbi:ABC-type nitrate/sulfonate/bicarbonate transport system, periplasmic component [Beggiatoa alba B18LD]|uniref:ABC-type nitrate/sulfonate/bicarbonate transport system, periplasmic component n=1 Tax=Beggiatoa alba B18LD TaxID=395493 RepID=I3CF87_9GAMM|nr:CmpA/NrtA family ABC transporter substrate-binding protein [Beggiatoa alba]EIJ42280.1 ABC-type nitrate/sulfonate/bicarbonate transport system, periplasmic component [Beggiatoa alba B18LD]